MKKIVALVLTLVLALSVSAVAFGADTVSAAYGKLTDVTAATASDITATFVPAVNPALTDGKQTKTANLAHYTLDKLSTGAKFVTVGSLSEADVVLYSDAAGKNVMMYLKKAVAEYNGSGTVFTNFGTKCGQVNFSAVAGSTYYTSNAKGDANIYVADKAGSTALLVNGGLVNVVVATANTTVKHAAVPTVKDGKITGYTCSICKAVAVEAPNFASIPSNAEQITGNWYFPVSAAGTATEGVTSPKTFDAGIAMYVGMSLMAVTGSAVVIGKKKEF